MSGFNPLAGFDASKTLTEVEQIERLQAKVDRLENLKDEVQEFIALLSKELNCLPASMMMVGGEWKFIDNNKHLLKAVRRLDYRRPKISQIISDQQHRLMCWDQIINKLKEDYKVLPQCKDEQGGEG